METRALRVAPVAAQEWTPEMREALGGLASSGRALNLYATLVRHPQLLKRWLGFAGHILFGSTLGARDRELVILRTGYRCKSEYEWGQHARIARGVGISEEEILRVIDGPEAPGWEPLEAALLRAADELHDSQVLSDATWEALAASYDVKQLFDLVFTVGQYTLVSMVLNTLGIQREADVGGFPS